MAQTAPGRPDGPTVHTGTPPNSPATRAESGQELTENADNSHAMWLQEETRDVQRCSGSLVVRRDGTVEFCTAGCHPTGAAHALATHQRFVAPEVLAVAIGTDERFTRALCWPGPPPPPT